MFNPFELLDVSQPFVLVVSASATTSAAAIAYVNFLRGRHRDMTAVLSKFLEEPGTNQFFVNAEAVLQADPWAVLDDAHIREAAGRTLTAFARMARIVPSRVHWHSVLEGEQAHTLARFLVRVAPLVSVVRHSQLGLTGKARFYNGNKRRAAAELYHVLGLQDPDRFRRPY